MSSTREQRHGASRSPPMARWAAALVLLVIASATIAVGVRVRAHRELVARFARHDGHLVVDPFGPDRLLSYAPRELLESFGTVRRCTFAKFTLRAFRTGFGSPDLDDEALRALAPDLERMSELEDLRIADASRLTSSGFDVVRRLRSLRTLHFANGPIGDEAVVGLATDLPNLVVLELPGTNVGDAAAREISRLPRLERLRLDGTAIGNDGAAHLATCPRLRSLSLTQTAVTERGIEQLARRIPELEISDD